MVNDEHNEIKARKRSQQKQQQSSKSEIIKVFINIDPDIRQVDPEVVAVSRRQVFRKCSRNRIDKKLGGLEIKSRGFVQMKRS